MRMLDLSARSTISRSISRHCMLAFLAAAAFSVPVTPAAAEPGVRSIQLVQHEKGAVAIYNVTLDRRFDTGELDSLSRRIKRSAPKSELIFISYFLRGMKSEKEPWATSHFNPTLDSFVVRINEVITAKNPPDADLRLAEGR